MHDSKPLPPPPEPTRTPAVGKVRNQPCACGSKRKTKHCHGASGGCERPSGVEPARAAGHAPRRAVFIPLPACAANNFRLLNTPERDTAERKRRTLRRTVRKKLKLAVLAYSSLDGKRIAAEKREQKREAAEARSYEERTAAYRRTEGQLYHDWYMSLSPDEQARAREMGVDVPEDDRERRGPQIDAEACAPAKLPEVAATWDPAAGLDGDIPAGNILADGFCAALAWCAQDGDLVRIGDRFLAMVRELKPCLLAGMGYRGEASLGVEFRAAAGALPLEEMTVVFAAALEWARRAGTVGRVGQRVVAMLFVMRPAFLNTETLKQIGDLNNRTRQAVDREVCDFRDTYNGLRGQLMRDESHRTACQQAQFSK